MYERQIRGFDLFLERRVVHESAYPEVRQQQTVEVLTGQFRNAAAKHHARAAKSGLELSEDRFDRSSSSVQVGQLDGRCLPRIHDRAEKTVLLPSVAEPIGD